jgi:hypothetical protein
MPGTIVVYQDLYRLLSHRIFPRLSITVVLVLPALPLLYQFAREPRTGKLVVY